MGTYRPRVFRFSLAADRRAFDELGKAAPEPISVCDSYEAQLQGLLKSREPRRRWTHDELRLESERHYSGRAPDEAGVWVFYPWRQTLVHLLDPEDFLELRTSRNRYKITGDEQRVLRRLKIGIVGLTGGSELAQTLAMEGISRELRLADSSKLELDHLNRMRESVVHLGSSKVTLAARAIAEIDPFIEVVCFDQKLTASSVDTLISGLDMLIEESPTHKTSSVCRRQAQRFRVPLISAAADRASLRIERFDRDFTRAVPSQENDANETGRGIPWRETGISDKLGASLAEVGESIVSLPRLASDVSLGAALATHVIRRIALEELRQSGLHSVELENIVADASSPLTSVASTQHGERLALSGSTRLEQQLQEMSLEPEPGQLALGADTLSALMEAAQAAPSRANEQPWHWGLRGSTLWLSAKPRFGCRLLDYRGGATQIALGTATENLVLKAHALGMNVKLDLSLSGQELGAVGFKFYPPGSTVPDAESHDHDHLIAQLSARCTNRRVMAPGRVPAASLSRLCEAAASIPSCQLRFVDDQPAIAEIATLAARAERIRMLHPVGARELLREIRWTVDEARQTRDGIDLATLDFTESENAAFSVLGTPGVADLLRRWRLGRGLENPTRRALLASSAIGMVGVDGDDARRHYLAGRAIQRLWLTATEQRLSLHPCTTCLYLFARAFGGAATEFDAETVGELYGLHARLRAVFGNRDREVFLFRVFPESAPPLRSLRRTPDMARNGAEQ